MSVVCVRRLALFVAFRRTPCLLALIAQPRDLVVVVAILVDLATDRDLETVTTRAVVIAAKGSTHDHSHPI